MQEANCTVLLPYVLAHLQCLQACNSLGSIHIFTTQPMTKIELRSKLHTLIDSFENEGLLERVYDLLAGPMRRATKVFGCKHPLK